MADRELKMHKRKFDTQLRHIKQIMVAYRKTMPQQQWLAFCAEVKNCIIKYPDHFICSGLPPKKLTREIIDLVFDGFLKDIHIRQVQAFRDTTKANA